MHRFFLISSEQLQGYTEITIVPTTQNLKTIHLHSRQCGASWERSCRQALILVI